MNWNQSVGTAWYTRATQVDKPVCIHRFISEETQGGRGLGAEEVVVPLVVVGVDEDSIGRELIVVGDNISQVGGGFVAHGGMRNEESWLGFGVHRIDKWFADTTTVSTAETT